MSSKNFLYDITEGLVSAFHEGFKNCKNKMKELFLDVNVVSPYPEYYGPDRRAGGKISSRGH